MENINLADILAAAFVLLLLGGAVCLMIRNKKKGKSCCGCPSSSECGESCSCCDKNKAQ